MCVCKAFFIPFITKLQNAQYDPSPSYLIWPLNHFSLSDFISCRVKAHLSLPFYSRLIGKDLSWLASVYEIDRKGTRMYRALVRHLWEDSTLKSILCFVLISVKRTVNMISSWENNRQLDQGNNSAKVPEFPFNGLTIQRHLVKLWLLWSCGRSVLFGF